MLEVYTIVYYYAIIMMILSIIQVWDEILTKKCIDIKDISSHLSFIEDMKKTLINTWNWVGLAAPQVGKSVRIFLMHPRPTSSYSNEVDEWLQVIINSKILAASAEKVTWYEGCLSISSQAWQWSLKAEVPRHRWIDVKYQNEEWTIIQKRLEGFASVIFQHEYDHLEWVLFLSRVENWNSLKSE